MSSTVKKVTLKSSDGETFEVDEGVAAESQTIRHMIEDDCADSAIPLPRVTGKILSKVIEYCKKHVESAQTDDRAVDEELETWDAHFVDVDQGTLFGLMNAAHYLDIEGLMHLTCRMVANMTKDKTPEELRKIFNIKNDFPPKKEENWEFRRGIRVNCRGKLLLVISKLWDVIRMWWDLMSMIFTDICS